MVTTSYAWEKRDSDAYGDILIPLYDILKFTIQSIPRSLEVCQSWSSSVVTTLNALLYSFSLVFRPDMVLCNSSGTCVPLCDAGVILGLKMVLIVYVESICRVESLSLCGKILYPLRLHTTFSLCYKWEHFALGKKMLNSLPD
uniref:UDP-N-acetylglucosamine transferase subunit ALG14 n=1 Tax=Oncorhynchus tshawytscha TaxID=74940 RepID=A0AAZ3P3V9_ONCTS